VPHQALTLRYRGRLALSTTHASNAPHTTLAPPPSLSSSFAPSDHHKHKIVADGMTTTSTNSPGNTTTAFPTFPLFRRRQRPLASHITPASIPTTPDFCFLCLRSRLHLAFTGPQRMTPRGAHMMIPPLHYLPLEFRTGCRKRRHCMIMTRDLSTHEVVAFLNGNTIALLFCWWNNSRLLG